jgi:hypothetical protein
MRLPVPHEGANAVEAGFDFIVADHPAAVLDAFIEADEMGRGEEAGIDARLPHEGVHEGAGAALAIRAGDVNEAHPVRRQFQGRQQAVDVVQAQLDAEKLGAVEPIEGGSGFRGHLLT